MNDEVRHWSVRPSPDVLKPQKGERQSKLAPYTLFKPIERDPENTTQAFETMTKNNFLTSQEWDNFVQLMGKETALKWFEAGLTQATRSWD